MDIDMAKQILGTCVKYELRDHAFGDMEVEWYEGDRNIATGHFSGEISSVCVEDLATGDLAKFKDKDARELLGCFIAVRVERNDTTGPDEFELGKTMPGLTSEGVRKELTGE